MRCYYPTFALHSIYSSLILDENLNMAIASQSIDDFILNLHDASMHLGAADFQRWTLNEMRRFIDFDFAIWGAGDGRNRQLHSATILDQVDTLFDTWEAVKHEDPFANLVIGNTGRTWTADPLPHFKKSRAYREHWRLYNAQQMLSTMEVDPKTGLHVFVTLARDDEHKRFGPEEIGQKSLITQHIFLAARHNDMHVLRSQQAPAAFIDKGGIINASLPEFSSMLAQEWGRRCDTRLPTDVTAALWQTGHYRGQQIMLNAQAVSHRLLVRAGVTPYVHLSEREREVAWAYVKGHTHKEVAKLLEVSPTTVRTHLARVYHKLDISDKASLALWLRDNFM